MTEERIIDLDYSDLPDQPERLRRGVVGRLRLIGLAVLALLCLAAFGGAARPPAPAFTYAGLITWPKGALENGRLLTLASGLAMVDLEGEVFAYDPDGRLAWRSRPFIDPAEGLTSYRIDTWEGNVLLVRSVLLVVAGNTRPSGTVSVALDPASGRERWRVKGTPTRVGNLVMVTEDQRDGSRSTRIYQSLPDGLLWTVPPAPIVATDPGTDALMTLTDEGLFTEYQLSTGTPRRSAHLRLPHLIPAEHELTMRLFRDRLILRVADFSRPERAVQTLSYDRATLQPATLSPGDQLPLVNGCGPVQCE